MNTTVSVAYNPEMSEESAVVQESECKSPYKIDVTSVSAAEKITSAAHLSTKKMSSSTLKNAELPSLSGLILAKDNPLRGIASKLRTQLGAFIEENLREPAAYGLNQVTHDPLEVTPVVRTLAHASRILDNIFTLDNEQTSLAISFRTFAQRFQLSVDHMRLFLVRSGYHDGVPESEATLVLTRLLDFKTEVSEIIQELDAYRLSVRRDNAAQS